MLLPAIYLPVLLETHVQSVKWQGRGLHTLVVASLSIASVIVSLTVRPSESLHLHQWDVAAKSLAYHVQCLTLPAPMHNMTLQSAVGHQRPAMESCLGTMPSVQYCSHTN